MIGVVATTSTAIQPVCYLHQVTRLRCVHAPNYESAKDGAPHSDQSGLQVLEQLTTFHRALPQDLNGEKNRW